MNGTFGAIEAGGTKFVVAVASAGGPILERARIETGQPGTTFEQVLGFFREAGRRHGPLLGLGVASFGPLETDPRSADYGRLLATPKQGWEGVSYREALAPLGVPLVIDTDVNGAALGEWSEGAGQGCETLAYTTVGTGIGTGIIHAGRPLAGIRHYEAGHIRVPHDPATDPFAGLCPFHGDCLEGLASGPAIKARYGTSLDRMADPDPAIETISRYLADLAVALVLLHAPDRLIFGGGVMKTTGLIEVLRKRTEERLGGYINHRKLAPGLQSYICLPGLCDDAGITGALALVRRGVAPSRGPS